MFVRGACVGVRGAGGGGRGIPELEILNKIKKHIEQQESSVVYLAK